LKVADCPTFSHDGSSSECSSSSSSSDSSSDDSSDEEGEKMVAEKEKAITAIHPTPLKASSVAADPTFRPMEIEKIAVAEAGAKATSHPPDALNEGNDGSSSECSSSSSDSSSDDSSDEEGEEMVAEKEKAITVSKEVGHTDKGP
jgi:hypothetical protein